MMGLLFERRATPEHPNAELTSSLVESLFLGDSTHAGTRVTPKKAMGLTALWATHRILAGTLGYLPFKVLERLPSGGRREASEHPLHSLIHTRANPEMSAQIFRETAQGHLINYGNTYAEVQRDRAGRPRALWPLLPDRTRVERRDKVKICITRLPSGEEVGLPPDQYLHIPGMGFDGLRGYAPLTIMRQAAGLGLALEEFAAKWFGQGSHLGGFLETDGVLSEDARKRVKASIPVLYEGLSNAHRMAVLEEGLKFKPLSVPPEDAQFLESRKFQIAEFSRMTGVPVHMLADVDRPFQSNVEHMGIELVVYVLAPWVKRWESVTDWELLAERDRARYYTKLSMDALLRGDFKARTEGYDRAIKGGWMTPNQARALEDMNPIDSEYGDSYLVPQNVSLASPDGSLVPVNQPEPRSTQLRELPASVDSSLVSDKREINTTGATIRHRLARSFVVAYQTQAGILVGREVKAVERAVDEVFSQRGRDAFIGWLQNYYGEKTQGFARDTMSGVVATYFLAIAREAGAEAGLTLNEAEFERQVRGFSDEYLNAFALRHTGKSLNALRKVLDEEASDELAGEAIRERLGDWSETRAAKIAGKETNKGNGMATLFTFALAGVERVTWVHLGKSCPLCEGFHGRTVEVRKPFAQPGDTVPGNETTSDLEVKHFISHPPLHAGCDCGLSAG